MITLYKNCPTLDLHGMDRGYAKMLINDFIKNYHDLRYETVVIVHGIGSGIIRKTTQDTLRHNKLVKSYKIDNFNAGQTIVKLNK